MFTRKLALLALLCMAACHSGRRPAVLWDGLSEGEKRAHLVQEAEQNLRARRLPRQARSFPYDCSGFVASVLFAHGIDVFGGASTLKIRGNGVTLIHRFVRRYGEIFQDRAPKPGDLVFFSNTWDRNRDGKLNDVLTHIAMVERMDRHGTITLMHHLGGRFRRDYMNLRHPLRSRDARGKPLNSYLRRRRAQDPKGTPYLAGGLFMAFGSLVPRS